MKKNLRIVSAAAAALLAVAPVAAAAVVSPATSVNADTETSTTVTGSLKSLWAGTAADGVYNTTSHTLDLGWLSVGNTDKKYVQKVLADEIGSQLRRAGASSLKVAIQDNAQEVAKTETLPAGIKYTFTVQGNKDWANHPVNHKSGVKDDGYLNYKWNKDGFIGDSTGKKITFTVTVAKSDAINGPQEHADSYFKAKDQAELNMHHAYMNNGNLYVGAQESAGIHNLGDLRSVIEDVVDFGYNNNQGENSHFVKYGKADWNKFVWQPISATNKAALMSQLRNQGISVAEDGVFDPKGSSYHITIWTNAGNRFTVYFQNTGYVDEDAPVIWGKYTQYEQTNNARTVNYGTTYGADNLSFRRVQPVKDGNGYVRPLIIEQHDDGTFQPTNWFGAWDSNKKHADINVTVKNNNVDWTKPGLYSIELTATNDAKKSEDVTVPVIVTAKNGNVMTVINNTNVYTEQNGAMVQANAVNFSAVVNPGNHVVVYGSPVTKKLNGVDTQFYRIVSPTANFYIPAKDLKNGVVSTPSTAQEQTTTKTVMHISTIYDKNGVATHEPALRAYDSVSVVSTPVTINGAKFYKLAGKDQYIKVGNIDGTSRTLKHNAYVYKSNGKARMASKKHHVVRKSGSSITTFGKSFMINGSQMYRVGRNQYIKKANFR